jgi:hypothetical protein
MGMEAASQVTLLCNLDSLAALRWDRLIDELSSALTSKPNLVGRIAQELAIFSEVFQTWLNSTMKGSTLIYHSHYPAPL